MICLIRPPAVEAFRFATTSITPPLGLAYIAAALESNKKSIQIIDSVGAAPSARTSYFKGYLVGLRTEQIIPRILPSVKFVGITVTFTHEWPVVVKLITGIKSSRPDVTIILGGEHVTAMPEFSLATSGADIVVLGEGEETVVDLISSLEQDDDISGVPGIAYCRNDRLIVNPRRARQENVDTISWPAWHHFDLVAYHNYGFSGGMSSNHPSVPILATRGCPYQCTYCASPNMWLPRWIPRDPLDVADEIEHYVRTYGARNFPFQDLTAIIQKDWIVKFCKEIIRRKLDITWLLPTGTRSEAINAEVATLLKESGMVSMAYAPESGSEATRQFIKKKMKTDRLFSSIRAAQNGGLNVAIFLVIGFPHDNNNHLRENLPFIDKLVEERVRDLSVGYYMALPGTELFHSIYDCGKLKLDEHYFRHILDSLSLVPSQSYSPSLGRLNLFSWKLRLFARFYASRRQHERRDKFWSRIVELTAGLSKKKHESRLQTAVKNGLVSAWTTILVQFKPAWIGRNEQFELFSSWDDIYRTIRADKLSQKVVSAYPENTIELHKHNIIESLKKEQQATFEVSIRN